MLWPFKGSFTGIQFSSAKFAHICLYKRIFVLKFYIIFLYVYKKTFFCFAGNSLSAILDGTAKLTFLKRGEDYFITMPYAHCKGKCCTTVSQTCKLTNRSKIDCEYLHYTPVKHQKCRHTCSFLAQ